MPNPMTAIRRWWERISVFLNGPYFDERFKTRVHYLQLSLAILVIILTGARLGTKPDYIPVSRADTLGIVTGIKSILVLSYQLLTAHVRRCKRWASTKANLVLNCIELPFWFVVIIIMLMSVATFCKGAYGALTWIIILIATVLEVLTAWAVVVTARERRVAKQVATTEKFSAAEEV